MNTPLFRITRVIEYVGTQEALARQFTNSLKPGVHHLHTTITVKEFPAEPVAAENTSAWAVTKEFCK